MYFLSILNIFFIENSFQTKIGHRNEHIYIIGALWQNLRLVHYLAEYLTPMLTLDMPLYRSSSLVLDLKI